MPFFLSLDYDRDADHLSGCGYVNQESFSRSGGTKMDALVRSAFKFLRASSALGVQVKRSASLRGGTRAILSRQGAR
jgi:hypothetical protein